MERNDHFEIDNLLKNIFDNEIGTNETLKTLFDDRLEQLGITKTKSLKILGIETRTLTGVLEGSLKQVDFTVLIKLASFLQIPQTTVINLFLNELQNKFPELLPFSSNKIEFINKNFDLAVLKKSGIINDLSNYKDIEEKLCKFLGINSIFEYQVSIDNVAFSAGKLKPKNNLSRSMWLKRGSTIIKDLDNPFPYDRTGLIDFFSDLRWYSTNVDLGFVNVVKILYRMGVTVIFQSSIPTLHLRGVVMEANGKPGIIITDYRGHYPTFWFSLVHELFHVLFDWDYVRKNKLLVSNEDTIDLTELERENEADTFARDYFLPKEKMLIVSDYLGNTDYINEFARVNHIHPSFIYLFNAIDKGNNSSVAWKLVHKHNPDINPIKDVFNNWNEESPNTINDVVKHLKKNVFV